MLLQFYTEGLDSQIHLLAVFSVVRSQHNPLDFFIDDLAKFPASNSDPYDHNDLQEMLEALHAFSSADFFLATRRLSDPNRPVKLSRGSIRKARESNLSALQKSIHTLKQDMIVSIDDLH